MTYISLFSDVALHLQHSLIDLNCTLQNGFVPFLTCISWFFDFVSYFEHCLVINDHIPGIMV